MEQIGRRGLDRYEFGQAVTLRAVVEIDRFPEAFEPADDLHTLRAGECRH